MHAANLMTISELLMSVKYEYAPQWFHLCTILTIASYVMKAAGYLQFVPLCIRFSQGLVCESHQLACVAK